MDLASDSAGPRPAVVLVPVKPPARGKSRLVGPAAAQRAALARGFVLDTVEACLAADSVRAVLTVTDDARLASELTALGCAAIPDGVSDDLNATLVQAAAEARRRWPRARPVALCADLPALRGGDLALALAGAGDGPAFVADAAGTGTTLYTAPYTEFAPHFGPDSARRHTETGACPIPGELATLRHDVDTLEDLHHARAYGFGRHTTLAVGALERA